MQYQTNQTDRHSSNQPINHQPILAFCLPDLCEIATFYEYKSVGGVLHPCDDGRDTYFVKYN